MHAQEPEVHWLEQQSEAAKQAVPNGAHAQLPAVQVRLQHWPPTSQLWLTPRQEQEPFAPHVPLQQSALVWQTDAPQAQVPAEQTAV